MKLNLNQIKNITQGAVNVFEKDGYFEFHRFTTEQEDLYSNPTLKRPLTVGHLKVLTSAGVKLRFLTNSNTLAFTAKFINGTYREIYSIDVFVNGEFFNTICSHESIPESYDKGIEEKEVTKSYNFESGEKEISIYLPFSTITLLKDFCLDDNSIVKPIKPSKKLLAFGDSITHGYDCLHSHKSYINLVATALDYEVYNKAIGGERFFPEFALCSDGFTPDLITIAYGTNDWSNNNTKPNDLISSSSQFIGNLRKVYKSSKIVVIGPIWRKDLEEEKPCGKFRDVAKMLEAQTKKFENVYFIDGFNFVPHDPIYYGDRRLHPNDKGFEHYAKNLLIELNKIL